MATSADKTISDTVSEVEIEVGYAFHVLDWKLLQIPPMHPPPLPSPPKYSALWHINKLGIYALCVIMRKFHVKL